MKISSSKIPMNKEYSELLKEAMKARESSYSPYSKFKVGSALLTKKGNIFSGCNVENASYGLTICGERNAIFQAVSKEGKEMKIKIIISVCDPGKNDKPYTSCGACRQVIQEFSDDDTIVISADTKGNMEKNQLKEILRRPFKL